MHPYFKNILVEKGFSGGAWALVVAVSPLTAIKLLISDVATVIGGGKKSKETTAINDVAHAFFVAPLG